jgi:hypothetical protein
MTSTIAQEVTEWFGMDIRPVREGWYEVERRWADGTVYDIQRYWWNRTRFVISDGLNLAAPVIDAQDVWRGLSLQPWIYEVPTC